MINYNITGTKPAGMNITNWIFEKSLIRLSWDLALNKKLSKRVIIGKKLTYGRVIINW